MDDMLPSTGEEYLRMVRAQARSCPAVAIAPRAQEYLSVKNTSLKYRTDWNSCRPAPEGCAPSAEWKEHFMKEFKEAKASLKRRQQSPKKTAKRRKTLNQALLTATGETTSSVDTGDTQSQSPGIPGTEDSDRTTPALSPPSTPPFSVRNSTSIVVPKMFDEKRWRSLLYGSTTNAKVKTIKGTTTGQEADSLSSTTHAESSVPTETSIEFASISGSTIVSDSPLTKHLEPNQRAESSMSTARIQVQGMIPQPQFLVLLNQGHLIQLLKYHVRWLAEDDITDHEGKWLYALLLKLDPLVEFDQVSLLRNLAKKCSRIRSHLNSELGSKLATVNMVITIVAQLFGQNDLE
ncbi:gem (nuclear organelle) associated protein 2 [Modicella reniformis]|uniref:Gem (Nuclear organelle) associated protein 2 n=1 Tax=Modicella reniformis TaxID=1440133 RepID=A0A9P6J2I9_9FUNG|nr:gem (nuclear organelle) associated protein 2 [Modicella reniformis]